MLLLLSAVLGYLTGDWCELAWELRMWSKTTLKGLGDVRKGFNCVKNGVVCKLISTYHQRAVELKNLFVCYSQLPKVTTSPLVWL